MSLRESIERSVPHLLEFQREDGRFEGELSSNTFPTCAYALVQSALGLPVDNDLIDWFIRSQDERGFWGLDAGNRADNSATLVAKLALKEIIRSGNIKGELRPIVESALAKIPKLQPELWIVKLLYARSGYISWDEVMAPRALASTMKIIEWLKPLLPGSLLSRIKPPTKFAPPVGLFHSSAFDDLFVAEKHTLVPLFLIMEIHTNRRREVMEELINWLLENRCADGSWFRVGLISALSLLALIDARDFGYRRDDVEQAIKEGSGWLQGLRSSDGGCREAINLNVWDTALSVIALSALDVGRWQAQIKKAVEWLIENQNEDGGWPFSGLPGGNLPSDADDTALAVLALLSGGINRDHGSVMKGVEWLRRKQSGGGGWGTYRPGVGDVSCVSITSHAILALLRVGGLDKEVEKAIEWLKSSISDSGYWSDLWLVRKTYGTASALDALIKAGHIDCAEVKRGAKWLESAQNPDGGWGEDFDGQKAQSTIEQTAWSSYALLQLDYSPSAKRGIEYLLSHQNLDGSWTPSCVGIYWEVIGGYIDPVYPYVFSLMALERAMSMSDKL